MPPVKTAVFFLMQKFVMYHIPLDFSIDLILQPHYGPGIDSASTEMRTRNLPGGKANKLTTICESVF
jgi:hypothetical protein